MNVMIPPRFYVSLSWTKPVSRSLKRSADANLSRNVVVKRRRMSVTLPWMRFVIHAVQPSITWDKNPLNNFQYVLEILVPAVPSCARAR